MSDEIPKYWTDKQPDVLPEPTTESWSKTAAPKVPAGTLALPPGYEAVICDKGATVREPKDRNGVLRRVNEIWYETTYLDGRFVPIMAKWLGLTSARYIRPKSFNSRRTCGAWVFKTQSWCTEQLDRDRKCPYGHCGAWSSGSGRACSKPRGFNKRCNSHTTMKAKQLAKENINKRWDMIYGDVLKGDQKKYHDYICSISAGADVTLKPELNVLRTLLRVQVSGDASAAAIMSKLTATWERYKNAKSQDERTALALAIDNLAAQGDDAVIGLKEMRATIDSIGKLGKMQSDIDMAKERLITQGQLDATLARSYGLMYEVFEKFPDLLMQYATRIKNDEIIAAIVGPSSKLALPY